MDAVFCIFGDSIVYGAWDFKDSGWASRSRKFLDEKNSSNLPSQGDYFITYNLGIDGDDTARLLKRFEIESEARFSDWEKETRKIIFAIGLNDSCYRKTKDNVTTPVNLFENNLLELIKRAKNFTREIIFLGFAKGNDSGTIPFPGSVSGECYDKENVKIYNGIIKKVCEKEKILFINILDKMIDDDFYDGLHPNGKGHQKIFEIVKDFLIEKKII